MSSTKLLGLVNLKTLPKDLPKLLDEPVNILKGAETEDFQAVGGIFTPSCDTSFKHINNEPN